MSTPEGSLITLRRDGSIMRELPFKKNTLVIGSHKECDIFVAQGQSRHVKLVKGPDGKLTLFNLEAATTQVNQKAVATEQEVVLNHMDTFTIATRHFRWEYTAAKSKNRKDTQDLGASAEMKDDSSAEEAVEHEPQKLDVRTEAGDEEEVGLDDGDNDLEGDDDLEDEDVDADVYDGGETESGAAEGGKQLSMRFTFDLQAMPDGVVSKKALMAGDDAGAAESEDGGDDDGKDNNNATGYYDMDDDFIDDTDLVLESDHNKATKTGGLFVYAGKLEVKAKDKKKDKVFKSLEECHFAPSVLDPLMRIRGGVSAKDKTIRKLSPEMQADMLELETLIKDKKVTNETSRQIYECVSELLPWSKGTVRIKMKNFYGESKANLLQETVDKHLVALKAGIDEDVRAYYVRLDKNDVGGNLAMVKSKGEGEAPIYKYKVCWEQFSDRMMTIVVTNNELHRFRPKPKGQKVDLDKERLVVLKRVASLWPKQLLKGKSMTAWYKRTKDKEVKDAAKAVEDAKAAENSSNTATATAGAAAAPSPIKRKRASASARGSLASSAPPASGAGPASPTVKRRKIGPTATSSLAPLPTSQAASAPLIPVTVSSSSKKATVSSDSDSDDNTPLKPKRAASVPASSTTVPISFSFPQKGPHKSRVFCPLPPTPWEAHRFKESDKS